jgi:uncharacterized protein YdeI (YjbR/CyaY-like superfamily)
MTPAGLAVIDPSVTPVVPPWKAPLEIPLYFRQALAGNEAARQFFEGLAPSYQRNFVSWVDAAQRPEIRQKRLDEALDLLEHKQKLGMK